MVLGPTTFDNHLSTVFTVRISVQFHPSHAPTKVWVASLRGLPRSIFYVSIKTSSLWHFQVYFGISEDVAILTAVTLSTSLGLFIRLAQTLLASQPVLAWTFLMVDCYHAIIQKLHTSILMISPERFVYQKLLSPNDSSDEVYQSL